MKAYLTVLPALALALTLGAGASRAQDPAPPAPAETASVVVADVVAPSVPVGVAPTAAEHRAARVTAMQAFQEALETSAAQQREALKAVEAAREALEAQSRETAVQASEAHEDAQRRDENRREMEQVQRELQRAHESLRHASREVARVHREINRPHPAPRASHAYAFRTSTRPVIGVVLGGSNERGVEVLGVSPDGPAERAGLAQGDVIVSVMDTPLAAGEEEAREVLTKVLEGVEAGDELVVAVERGGEARQYTVVPEVREPITIHSFTRLPSAPPAPGVPLVIERMEIPGIDQEGLHEDMARLREELDRTRSRIEETRIYRFCDSDQECDVDVERFSGFGDAVVSGTNTWFGMPMVRGLKMAAMDPQLGRYFETDQGVLVLRARDDNELQLQTGDVILAIGGEAVSQPSDVMRALRGLESGTQLSIDIKRERHDQSLVVEVPERQPEFHFEAHTD